MEIEEFASLETGKREVFIRFTRDEMQEVVAMCKRRKSDLNRNIRRIESNPNNEGQVTYRERVRECKWGIEFAENIIKTFS
jgi:hypothetical protein